jgi:hypothetical protein
LRWPPEDPPNEATICYTLRWASIHVDHLQVPRRKAFADAAGVRMRHDSKAAAVWKPGRGLEGHIGIDKRADAAAIGVDDKKG